MGRKNKRSNWRRWEDNVPAVKEPTPVNEEELKRIAEEQAAIEKAKKLYAAFQRFPLEVLGSILKCLPSTDEYQLTCKSFRNNVLQIPSLWTFVSSDKNPEYYIQRSKGCGLDVQIEFTDSRLSVDRLRVFFLLLEPHHSRFKALTIHGTEDRSDLWKIIHSQLLDQSFASLEVLGYGIENTSSRRLNPFTSEVSQKDLISSFSLPSLTTLKVKNVFPPETIKIKTPPTEFALGISHYKGSANGHSISTSNRLLDSITSLIQSYDKLSELTLRVDSSQLNFSAGRTITVDIPTLRFLDIQCVSSNAFLPTAGISAPNLAKLLIKCDDMEDRALKTLLEDLFRSDVCRWPCLKILDIDLTKKRDFLYNYEPSIDGQEHVIDIVLTRLPNIKSLSVTSRRYLAPTAISVLQSERHGPSSYPPLQSLSISDSQIETAFLVANREILVSPTFKELRVAKCSSMMKNVLRSILPSEKSLIYDGTWVPPVLV